MEALVDIEQHISDYTLCLQNTKIIFRNRDDRGYIDLKLDTSQMKRQQQKCDEIQATKNNWMQVLTFQQQNNRSNNNINGKRTPNVKNGTTDSPFMIFVVVWNMFVDHKNYMGSHWIQPWLYYTVCIMYSSWEAPKTSQYKAEQTQNCFVLCVSIPKAESQWSLVNALIVRTLLRNWILTWIWNIRWHTIYSSCDCKTKPKITTQTGPIPGTIVEKCLWWA